MASFQHQQLFKIRTHIPFRSHLCIFSLTFFPNSITSPSESLLHQRSESCRSHTKYKLATMLDLTNKSTDYCICLTHSEMPPWQHCSSLTAEALQDLSLQKYKNTLPFANLIQNYGERHFLLILTFSWVEDNHLALAQLSFIGTLWAKLLPLLTGTCLPPVLTLREE